MAAARRCSRSKRASARTLPPLLGSSCCAWGPPQGLCCGRRLAPLSAHGGALMLRCLYLWPGAHCMVERAGSSRTLSLSAGAPDPARGKGVRVRGLGWGSKLGRFHARCRFFSRRCCRDFGSREWANARLRRASPGRSRTLGPAPAACSRRRIVRSHSRVCLGQSSSLLVVLLLQPRRIARARWGPVGACDAVRGGAALRFYHAYLKYEFAGRPRCALGVRGARPGGDVIWPPHLRCAALLIYRPGAARLRVDARPAGAARAGGACRVPSALRWEGASWVCCAPVPPFHGSAPGFGVFGSAARRRAAAGGDLCGAVLPGPIAFLSFSPFTCVLCPLC